MQVVLLVALCVASALAQRIVALRRLEPAGSAALSLLDDQGNVNTTSSITWTFLPPHIQSTVDSDQRHLWVVTYPTTQQDASGRGNRDPSGALVFQFDRNLLLLQSIKPTIALFDFQYSTRNKCNFGIAVASQFSHVFSRFDILNGEIVNSSIEALPWMYFVNASTFDRDDDIYYGLLNYFPGQANYSNTQKLFIGRVSSIADVSVIDLEPAEGQPVIAFRFLSWSHETHQLIGVGTDGPARMSIATIDPLSGRFTEVMPLGPYAVGVAPVLTRSQPCRDRAAVAEACLFYLGKDGEPCLECIDLRAREVTQRMCYTMFFGSVWQTNML